MDFAAMINASHKYEEDNNASKIIIKRKGIILRNQNDINEWYHFYTIKKHMANKLIHNWTYDFQIRLNNKSKEKIDNKIKPYITLIHKELNLEKSKLVDIPLADYPKYINFYQKIVDLIEEIQLNDSFDKNPSFFCDDISSIDENSN